MKRKLDVSETKEILSLKESDINMGLIRSFFAIKKGKRAARFNTFDTITLPKGHLYNKEEIDTTVGRYIFNFFCLPEPFLKKFGFQNLVFNKSAIGDLEEKLANMLLDDLLTTKDYAKYLDNAEWLTLGTTYFLSPTMDYDMNVPIPAVIKRRDELFKEYEKEIKEGDTNAVAKLEKELIELSRKLIKEKGNEGYDFFESGSFSFENNYKKTSIMGGVMESPYTKKLDVLKSNYMEGISKEEFPLFSNSTIVGGYSRGVETQKAGYETKKINNATQVIKLDEKETDCGTNQYLNIKIHEKMKSMFFYRYILDGSKIVMLNEDNINKYAGKDVKMRSPMYCKTDDICSRCAGDLYYRIGIKNAGLLSSTMSGSIMNLSLKKTHDQTIKFTNIDPRSYIKEH
jgi:hypothetical protein